MNHIGPNCKRRDDGFIYQIMQLQYTACGECCGDEVYMKSSKNMHFIQYSPMVDGISTNNRRVKWA